MSARGRFDPADPIGLRADCEGSIRVCEMSGNGDIALARACRAILVLLDRADRANKALDQVDLDQAGYEDQLRYIGAEDEITRGGDT